MKYIKKIAIVLIAIVLIYFLLNITNYFFIRAFSDPLLEPNSKWYCEKMQMTVKCDDRGAPIFAHISTPEGDMPAFIGTRGSWGSFMQVYIEDDNGYNWTIASGSLRISIFKQHFYLKCDTVYSDSDIPSELKWSFKEHEGELLVFKKID